MGPLVRAVLVLMLLDLALPLIPEQQVSLGVPTTEAVPSLNMNYDLRTQNLTWECREDAMPLECAFISEKTGPVRMKLKDKKCHCTFERYELHQGVEFTVTMNTSQGRVTEKLIYSNPGGENTAAQKFSCFVYNVDFLNCTWQKGPAAPPDVQYTLYIREIKRRQERECPHYVQDAGTHVGCHLRGVSGFNSWIYFLVTGTSRERGIQFFDTVMLLKTIEIYNPPTGISVLCNKTHCAIHWQKPRTRQNPSNLEFQYELDIQRQGEALSNDILSPKVEVSGLSCSWNQCSYTFPSPEPRPQYTVQIRAADSRLLQWSDWSLPVEFGSGEREHSPVYLYMFIVLATLVCILLVTCLFKRFVEMPIPHIKDKLNTNHPMDNEITWEKFTPPAGKADHEEVLTVEEVPILKASV